MYAPLIARLEEAAAEYAAADSPEEMEGAAASLFNAATDALAVLREISR